jgi:hypothetical protein
MKAYLLTALAVAAFGITSPSCLAASPRVPIIATGWDSPNTRQFRDGLAAFEACGVFDGTTLRTSRWSAGGKEQQASMAFSRETWQWSEFAPALADLRAAKPATCRENYLMLYSNPGDVDWFDDVGWSAIVDHWRFLARLARQGGLRGLLFDAEPYTPPHSQYRYGAQAETDRHTFAEYRAKARQRGRDAMRAVCAEYPEITIFSYRLFSDMLSLLDSGDPTGALAQDTYGLLPSFVDGWLDVMPSTVTVIEGTEDIGYHANSPAEYNAAFTRLTLHMPDFVAPENRDKLRGQFRIGHSLYLDAYVNPPGDPWHIDLLGGTAAARLAANLGSALGASNGLVWLYGEKGNWWPSGSKQYQAWRERMPGIIAAISKARDPEGFARNVFRRTPAPPNLLANVDFRRPAMADGSPTGWFFWQEDISHGRARTESGVVAMRSVQDGAVGRMVPIVAGRTYAVRLRIKSQGRGLACLLIGWKSKAAKWTAGAQNRRFVPLGAADSGGYREAVGLVEAPPEVGYMMFLACVNAQRDDADRCWFSDPAIVEVTE